MFRRLLAALGRTGDAAAGEVTPRSPGPSGPYAAAGLDGIYEMLFCDDATRFAPRAGTPPAPWQQRLYAPATSPADVLALAVDEAQESRVRALAFHWLRERGHAVPEKQLLGTVVEVPLPGGLDTLAAYADGQVRYLNQAGKLAVFDGGPPSVTAAAAGLLAASAPVVARIGPWEGARLPPPEQGLVRMTFLVSDGLYFGQGPFAQFQADAMAGPVIAAASALLQAAVDAALQTPAG